MDYFHIIFLLSVLLNAALAAFNGRAREFLGVHPVRKLLSRILLLQEQVNMLLL